MNIPEAIEILERTQHYYESGDTPRTQKALQLGIEALRRIRQLRVIELNPEAHHLRGETEE